MVAGADKPVAKQSAPLPSFLSESMKISRMVEVLEGLFSIRATKARSCSTA